MTRTLEDVFPAKQLKRDADSLVEWGRDWTRNHAPNPCAVVFPESVAQVVELVALANAELA